MVFCSFLHLFPCRFFPFLIIFKTGFSGYWNLIARFNIFRSKLDPQAKYIRTARSISQPPNPPTPNQIEQETGDEEIQLAVTAKFCIDSDPTSMRFIVWRARYGLDYARFIISNLLINWRLWRRDGGYRSLSFRGWQPPSPFPITVFAMITASIPLLTAEHLIQKLIRVFIHAFSNLCLVCI